MAVREDDNPLIFFFAPTARVTLPTGQATSMDRGPGTPLMGMFGILATGTSTTAMEGGLIGLVTTARLERRCVLVLCTVCRR